MTTKVLLTAPQEGTHRCPAPEPSGYPALTQRVTRARPCPQGPCRTTAASRRSSARCPPAPARGPASHQPESLAPAPPESLALAPLATVTHRPAADDSSSGHCPSPIAAEGTSTPIVLVPRAHGGPNSDFPTLECTTLQLAHGPSRPGLDGTPIQPPIQAGARRRTTPGAHPRRGSTAHQSRSTSRPGLDGTKLQEPIQPGARRRTTPRAHPGRGSTAKICQNSAKTLQNPI